MAKPPPDAAQWPDRQHAHAYRLVSRALQPQYRGTTQTRVVEVGPVRIGGDRPVIVAGPCSVESREQTLAVARAVKEAGGQMLRGGAFKPRTSPYDFQGLGQEGLEILAEAREVTGLPFVTEALGVRQVELVASYADCIQVGARSMQNFPLLQEVGKAGKPVLLKRHWGATLTEWLCAAEYIAAEGNLDVILCERGIRTFTQGDYNRSTLDLNVIPVVRRESYLPVLVDPSHGTGDPGIVPGAALAGICAGAHGVLIEVIPEDADVKEILCDGFQSIRPSVLASVVRSIEAWSGGGCPTEYCPTVP